MRLDCIKRPVCRRKPRAEPLTFESVDESLLKAVSILAIVIKYGTHWVDQMTAMSG